MSAMSNYLEEKLIDHIFRGTSYTAPTTVKVGLVKKFVAADLEAGTLTEEMSGNTYAAQSVGPGSSDWDAIAGGNGATANTARIEFPQATADWGHISGVYISDESNNVLLYGQLTTTRFVRDGDQFVFAAGDLDITFA